MNGEGDRALTSVFTRIAEECRYADREVFDRRTRPILRAIAMHQHSEELRDLKREARRIFAEVKNGGESS